ncbi:MAG: hypothetical protein E6I08_05540 [Chloroflexi bacterium]|nr:MAG: hypothetical protein E6I08_05540 [Chloroflexota bacterium]
MSGTKGTGGPREEVDTGENKLYVRRNEQGEFSDVTDEGRSLAADRRQHAEHDKPRHQGDKGD